MLLLHINSSKNNLKMTTMLALGIWCIMLLGNFKTTEAAAAVAVATNETSSLPKQEGNNKTPVELGNKTPKTVKKELQATNETVVIITPPAKDDHTEKLVIIDEKSLIENSGKGIEQQPPPAQEAKVNEKTGLLETVTKEATVQHAQPYQHHINEEFVLNDVDDMSESLKTGFYFFLILSSAAIVFIVFKIYRLRLSRAERKYGVQGDRSTQELTPLPISIEDGHSDDEDQTLFEVQRQNIRIL